MKISKKEKEFLEHSNWIEREYSNEAYEDSVRAWQYAKISSKNGIDVNAILIIHDFLMQRLNKRIAGKFRMCDVYIGGVRKMFVSTKLIEHSVELYLEEIQITLNRHPKDKEEVAKKLHVMFEEIHPFEDGNGRTGRILYNVHRLQLDLGIHIIHEGDEQMSYYKWFQK